MVSANHYVHIQGAHAHSARGRGRLAHNSTAVTRQLDVTPLILFDPDPAHHPDLVAVLEGLVDSLFGHLPALGQRPVRRVALEHQVAEVVAQLAELLGGGLGPGLVHQEREAVVSGSEHDSPLGDLGLLVERRHVDVVHIVEDSSVGMDYGTAIALRIHHGDALGGEVGQEDGLVGGNVHSDQVPQ